MDSEESYEEPMVENDGCEEPMVEKDDYEVENLEVSISCSICGFENRLDNAECVICKKNLNEYDGLENTIPCYNCGLLLPVTQYEEHTTKCQFLIRILALKEEKIQDFKKTQQNQRINNQDIEKCKYCDSSNFVDFIHQHERNCEKRTKACIYCQCPYLIDQIHEHEINCQKKTKPYETLQINPKIAAVDFNLGSVLEKSEIERLTKTQIQALIYMHKKAKYYSKRAKKTFKRRLRMFKDNLGTLQNYMKIVPFVIHVNLSKYLEFFLTDNSYRNLFETDKRQGCTEKLWRKEKEDKIFNNIFFDAEHHERVKYGVINIINHPEGVAPAKGYGRSYFILKDHVKPRCTFTYENSSINCDDSAFGTFDNFSHVFEKFTDFELQQIFKATKGDEVSWEWFKTNKQIQIMGPIQFSKDIEMLCIDLSEIKDIEMVERILSFTQMFGVRYKLFGK